MPCCESDASVAGKGHARMTCRVAGAAGASRPRSATVVPGLLHMTPTRRHDLMLVHELLCGALNAPWGASGTWSFVLSPHEGQRGILRAKALSDGAQRDALVMGRGQDMQLLIAHAHQSSREALTRVVAGLPDAELHVVESDDSEAALDRLLSSQPPSVALIDWDLSGCDGPELCRLVRAYYQVGRPYIILLASKTHRLAEGLEAGADDCVHGPVRSDELQARVRVGLRYAALSPTDPASVTLVADMWPDDSDQGPSCQSEGQGVAEDAREARLAALNSEGWNEVAESRGRQRFELDTLLCAG